MQSVIRDNSHHFIFPLVPEFAEIIGYLNNLYDNHSQSNPIIESFVMKPQSQGKINHNETPCGKRKNIHSVSHYDKIIHNAPPSLKAKSFVMHPITQLLTIHPPLQNHPQCTPLA